MLKFQNVGSKTLVKGTLSAGRSTTPSRPPKEKRAERVDLPVTRKWLSESDSKDSKLTVDAEATGHGDQGGLRPRDGRDARAGESAILALGTAESYAKNDGEIDVHGKRQS
jgi:hypothetical protein